MSSNATSGGRVLGRASRLGSHRVRAWTRTLESPLTTYYGLLAVTGLLVGIGLVIRTTTRPDGAPSETPPA